MPLSSANSPAGSPQPTPAQILLRLFRPEASEIRTLVLFAIVVGVLSLVTPLAVESLVNTVAFVGLLQPIIILAIVMMACLGLAAVILALEAVLVELIQRRLFARVVTALSRRLPRSCRATLDGAYGPELANRFFELPILQKVGAKLLLDGLTVGLSAAVGLIVLAFYHPLLLAFGGVLVVLLAIVIFVMGRGAIRSAIAESSAKYRTADWVEQMMRHSFAFQLGRGRQVAAERADHLTEDYLEQRRGHYRILFRQLATALALQVVMSTLLLGLGGWLVTDNQLTLGQLVAAWLIVSIVLSAVAKLGAQLESLYDILASCGKLGVLLDLPVDREDGQPPVGAGPAPLVLHELTHPRITPPKDETTVHFELDAGQSMAVYGPSGSGKSTLLQLIHGQREPASGRIDYDGINLRALALDGVRDQVALACADDVIAGTVLDNITLGREGLSLDEVRRALQRVGLWEAVQALPRGLDTHLTSFGPPLSTTQSDLLVLARALAARPRLLLVDGLLDRLDGAALDRALSALLEGPRRDGTEAGAPPMDGPEPAGPAPGGTGPDGPGIGPDSDRSGAAGPPWTLIVATQRQKVADRFENVLRLAPRPASRNTPQAAAAPAAPEEPR